MQESAPDRRISMGPPPLPVRQISIQIGNASAPRLPRSRGRLYTRRRVASLPSTARPAAAASALPPVRWDANQMHLNAILADDRGFVHRFTALQIIRAKTDPGNSALITIRRHPGFRRFQGFPATSLYSFKVLREAIRRGNYSELTQGNTSWPWSQLERTLNKVNVIPGSSKDRCIETFRIKAEMIKYQLERRPYWNRASGITDARRR